MLVLYDSNGVINQCIVQSQFTEDELAARYTALGIPNLKYAGAGNISDLYVKNGEVLPKEQITVTGDIRQLKADGVDTLSLTISPANFTCNVIFEGKLIHSETDTTGKLDLTVDNPGTYTVQIDAGFPYMAYVFTVGAVAP